MVIGQMYDDANDIWEDGEDAVIRCIDWVESVHFFLAVTAFGAVKCPKDEERKYARKILNGSDNPEKG